MLIIITVNGKTYPGIGKVNGWIVGVLYSNNICASFMIKAYHNTMFSDAGIIGWIKYA